MSAAADEVPGRDDLPLIVYFSSVSENTQRFVHKLGARSQRIPLIDREGAFRVDEPYVLISPTYGGGKVSDNGAITAHAGGGYVPKQVIKFLNVEHNRALIRGVIAAGNTNFGAEFCMAGDIIAAKCHVPYLYRFELMGTPEDVVRVRDGLADFIRAHRAPAH
ncbi:class Ib ribonucleoside-diphosphate reductase assembly flavoprotein NrdI [Gordonia sp. HY442]|uniref:class Ib ribonucleoside-diphosphate reductase assembly flavoprotein NrdI n=1 Tax=Gordonia zhenghanii TaxID=2911516 RepID=UPI001F01EC5B|nr:class Ib ribonucleoside-diphosphate reductase assembly flavoprotein NrdI [Gordonia zhenghanii]MCF8607886.1 class Ib ribonucleoside-diphosphate reductase assembly flavoprotein NrdI [Gordonia zhenghanii]